MNIPVEKNRRWVALLQKSIAGLDERQQAALMEPCGQGCAEDILVLCRKFLGRKVGSIDDLVEGWNRIREQRGLTGRWERLQDGFEGVFGECGCPLVSSGLVELGPVHCWCSQGMMGTIFSKVAGRPVQVELRKTIGRGDRVCHFLVKLSAPPDAAAQEHN